MKTIKVLDLFSGMGGMHIGLQLALSQYNKKYILETIGFSDIKKHSHKILNKNFNNINIYEDITKIDSNTIPDFDILLAGFPCQAFSMAGKRAGFNDIRGTLFFEIARILKDKKPKMFLLENVEGLVSHDKKSKKDQYGNTLKVILEILEDLGYSVSWKVLNSLDFGVAQERKRVYIVGSLDTEIELGKVEYQSRVKNKEVIESGLSIEKSDFIQKLMKNFPLKELCGKSIKDKRGGKNNIHSWEIKIKGEINKNQVKLLNQLLKERRKKHWASLKGIEWMDGMPLTLTEIKSFFNYKGLKQDLEDLVLKGYIVKEHPKQNIILENGTKVRVEDKSKPLGYNIVSGKLSFPISTILDPEKHTPTLLATDIKKIYVVDFKSQGLRKLSRLECLRFFGYPNDYDTSSVSDNEFYDLIGNTVVVPVIEQIAKLMIKSF